MAGLGGIVLQLLAQLPHEHAQVLGVPLRIVAPDRLQQRAVRDDAIRAPRHVDEQIEFLWRETDVGGPHGHAALIEIDAKRARLEPIGRVGNRSFTASQCGPDARQQLASPDWPDDVIVRAGIKRVDFERLVAIG